ncbi:type III polyketide synthase [Amycolatopsis sp. NBC_01488]|uniref:3,5-dihydroxyphenylacetyl-CoA synthase DpgA n=1 Tax=Amycolatopsis sp. NBC_01488 TaxID=2903563 RepID=UPI002E2D008E|nr:3,5-dihydroxyphenylacetyl-CoA synthase DpgA [Amycolatopsis sp. NBC_01488]
MPPARLLGVGTATPPTAYSQLDLLGAYDIRDPRIRSVFLNGGIERRYLTLPPIGPDGTRHRESQGELLEKNRNTGIEMGVRAVEECLKKLGADVSDVGHLCCVSSTGFLTPGFSALVLDRIGLGYGTARLDVVGMGCNAGLNALGATTGWARSNPGELGILACIEACSAAYVFDGTMRTSVVNSLFGDGAAALAVCANEDSRLGPQVLRFASRIIPEAIGAMRYDWDEEQGKFSFFLDREVPYEVGANAEEVVDRLLSGTGIRRSEIAQWVVHSGGRKVIDSVMVNLGLTRHDLRHTKSVLRDYGNLSSGSFLFSYERLLAEGRANPGEYWVLMTMGPGSTIETALIQW